jgi:hypothetical protein
MNESREILRQRFQAQTDVEIDPEPENWKRYAVWLEKLSIKELNSELAKENEMLRNKMQEAMGALEAGITGTRTKWEKSDTGYIRISKYAVEFLGYQGRMLYRSKSMKKPTTIFNASIFNSKAEKIWYGDLEIERDRKELIALSKREGELYIPSESDGGFIKQRPTADYVKDCAAAVVKKGIITYSKEFETRVNALKQRSKMGKR